VSSAERFVRFRGHAGGRLADGKHASRQPAGG